MMEELIDPVESGICNLQSIIEREKKRKRENLFLKETDK